MPLDPSGRVTSSWHDLDPVVLVDRANAIGAAESTDFAARVGHGPVPRLILLRDRAGAYDLHLDRLADTLRERGQVVGSLGSPWGSPTSPKTNASRGRHGLPYRRPLLGHRSCVPQSPTGTTGAPVASARRATPRWNRCISVAPSSFTRPSGASAAIAPAFDRADRLVERVDVALPRRIGIWSNDRRIQPGRRLSKTSAATRKRDRRDSSGRPRCRRPDRRCTLTWLNAMIADALRRHVALCPRPEHGTPCRITAAPRPTRPPTSVHLGRSHAADATRRASSSPIRRPSG